MDNHGAEDRVSVSVHDYECSPPDSDAESAPSPVLFRELVANGMLSRVEELDKVEEMENGVIKNMFDEVMIVFGEGTVMVAVHKVLYTGCVASVRSECFLSTLQVVTAIRGGEANVQYGWYGGSRAEICNILRYGFGRCGYFDKGVSHGIGVYLAPENNPIESVLRASEDENRIRHMLLCRIILGRTETIPAGSKQVYPSSTNFDTGVDNPLEPSTYTIWSAYMNSHILPLSIFSFKVPIVPVAPGNHRITRDCARKPIHLLGSRFCLIALSKFLHTSKTRFVMNCYNDFWVRVFGTFSLIDMMVIECVMCVCSMPCQQEYKIDRSELIRRFRSFAGDDVITFGSKSV